MSDSTKRYPVILFPGIAGSRLKTKDRHNNVSALWINQDQLNPLKTTLSLNLSSDDANTSTQEVNSNVSLSAIVASDKTEADVDETFYFSPAEAWQKHMKLQADGINPKMEENISEQFNREVEGLEGIKNIDFPLDDSAPNEDNQYYQGLIDTLTANGYQENVDLIGHPYDWRVAPRGLEQRYGTFSKLKTKIEELHAKSQLPVVLIAHSMGNRLVQYFLKWIESTISKAWIDEHIERYIAISPPWIGAPQAIYRLSDSAILLPAGKSQIGLIGMKDVLQSFSSIPWLLPVTEEQYKYFNTQSFGYYKEDDSDNQQLDNYNPVTVEFTLEKAEAQTRTLAHQTTFYKNDSLITEQTTQIIGSELIKCPAVQKLDVIYSTGFNTPVGAYYEYKDYADDLSLKKRLRIVKKLGEVEPIEYPGTPGLVIKQGIILETPQTQQQIEVDFSDGSLQNNSGDLVVPYGSLTYFKKWKQEEPNRYIQGHEFPAQLARTGKLDTSLNHNAIVAHPNVIERIMELLSK
jgi:hypothetical protein